jgi:hypothetical protein
MFECATEGMEERSRSCPGEAEEAAAALAGQVLSMTPKAKFFHFRHLGVLRAEQCTEAATMPPVRVVPAAACAAPRQVSSIAWVFLCVRNSLTQSF